MAFRSNGPVTFALPPFRGVTRRIILTVLIAYFVTLLLDLVLPDLIRMLVGILALTPDTALPKQLWQLITYPFFGGGLLSVLFSALSIWYFGSTLEEDRGGRWLTEFFFVSTAGGAILACVLVRLLNGRVLGIDPSTHYVGLWPFTIALIVAFAAYYPEQPITFNFILTLKAKYLAAIYVLIYLALTLSSSDRLGGLLTLCVIAAGVLYIRLAPRRGLRAGLSERWFSLRNAYYRAKRRRAAKKFAVYMRKQGKEVSLDDEGRYIDPNGKPRELNDRNWMN